MEWHGSSPYYKGLESRGFTVADQAMQGLKGFERACLMQRMLNPKSIVMSAGTW